MPANRLPLRSLPTFFEDGKTIRFRWGKCVWLSNTQPNTRFTVIVPKTVYKLATQRNRLKRQVRAQLLSFSPTPPVDLAIILQRPSSATLIIADLKAATFS